MITFSLTVKGFMTRPSSGSTEQRMTDSQADLALDFVGILS